MYRFFKILIMMLSLVLVFTTVLAVKNSNSSKSAKNDELAVTKPAVPEADILAEYDGGIITKQDLDDRISKIPPQAQGRYKTVDGQSQILDMMVVEDVFYQKAKEMNLLNDPTVLDKINAARKQVLIQEFYKRNVNDQVKLTEAEKQDYYEQNKKDFFVQPNITILYIQAEDEAAANKAMNELKKGTPFIDVSNKYSQNSYAKSINGKIKNIRLNGYIPGIGNDAELEEIIKNSPVDTLNYIGPNQTSTGWSIIQVADKVEGRQRPYLECEAEVDQRLRPIKESDLMNRMIDSLKVEYNVVVDTLTINKINLREPSANTDLESLKIVTAPDTSLAMSVADLLDKFNKMSPQEQMMYIKGGGAEQMVKQELSRNLMYLEAMKDKSYQDYLAGNEDFQQAKRYYVLQEAYKRLVVDQIDVNPEEMRSYYDTHLDAFTTPAARKIQVVWCKDEKTANKALKKFYKAVKKNKEKTIASLVKKYTIKPEQEILDNLYNNGIVTGIGPDQKLSQLIWNTPVGAVSPVTKSVKNDILFFRVLEERPPIVQSYTEVEPRLQGQLKKEKEKTQMETVKEQLFTQYGLKKYPEKLEIKLSASELFDLADNAARQRKYKDATIYYDQIIQFYPNGTDDYKAAFMKAFLTTEEIGNKELGLQLFKDFLKKYPTGELNESAQYMIDELEGKNTPLDEMNPDEQGND